MTSAPSQYEPLRVVRLDRDLPLPTRAHAGDAGIDLYSAVDLELAPGRRQVVGTGLAVALPYGTVGLVHPRSGLAARAGLSIVNAPGTIDAGYRGEIKICLINTDPEAPILISRGDRIAQLLVQRVELPEVLEVDELDDSERGTGGYGSSGGHAMLSAEHDPASENPESQED
ncbi:MAG: dUTP diphosphatase [Gordonia sp. (in: high G+C Gram-positive bacteria)]|uniref:dUTP diphosphatase n=1 Tax=Gordonia sp. (in: high G+C Gram-positive bacteria) TaxID=84139 RepID=UPI0039E4336C